MIQSRSRRACTAGTTRTALTTLLALVAAAAGTVFACYACVTPPIPELRAVTLGELEDVLEGPTTPEPAGLWLVGGARDVETLLAERQRLADQGWPELRTVVDTSSLDELGRTELGDRLLEVALEGGGPILMDGEGTVARSLRDGAPTIQLAQISPLARVLGAVELPGAGAEAERGVLEARDR